MSSKFLVEPSELKIFSTAEREAITYEKGIWKKSDYYKCFNVSLDYRVEVVNIKANCKGLSLFNWTIKDESRKVYFFGNINADNINLHSTIGKDNETDVFWNSKTPIWNNDRDSIYIFDSEGKIVFYDDYGY